MFARKGRVRFGGCSQCRSAMARGQVGGRVWQRVAGRFSFARCFMPAAPTATRAPRVRDGQEGDGRRRDSMSRVGPPRRPATCQGQRSIGSGHPALRSSRQFTMSAAQPACWMRWRVVPPSRISRARLCL